MILNTGQRTDIPSFFPLWLSNRIKEGFVLVRNPYNPSLVTRYEINPQVVDAIGFCTKNPAPFFPYLDLVRNFGQFWYVTITPYGKDIEPGVPDKAEVIEGFKYLSGVVGAQSVGWRYDPIFVDSKYTVDFHLRAFEKMASELEGFTKIVVISFIDLYEKVKRNFPQVREVSPKDKLFLGRAIIKIAADYGMIVKPCGEGDFLAPYGTDCGGCMTIRDYERAIGKKLKVPNYKPSRKECACYLSADIGSYDTCRHYCKYCYANNDLTQVAKNQKLHNPASPFLIGGSLPGDKLHVAEQKSWVDNQLELGFE